MTTGLRILMLEDSPADAMRIVDTLREAELNFEWQRVDCPADFAAALHPVPDVILADNTLRRFDVRSALELLRLRELDIPLIIVSGSASEDLAVLAMQQGVVDYLRKDQLGRLGRSVNQALELRRLSHAHRKAEDEAIVWRSRYEAAVRASGQLLYDWDLSDNTVIYGGDTERILGYTIDELGGGLDRWLRIVHDDDRERFQSQIRQAEVAGDSFGHEYRMVRKDGNVIYCESRGHFVRDAAGRLVRKVGFVTDVTERHRSEDRLRDSQRMLETVLNNIPIGVFWKDRESRYLGCNRTVSRAFGFSRPED
jgi:PAS domain S-box-containing protein